MKGAYAAAIGTIVGARVLLGRIAIVDWVTIVIALAALFALSHWKVSNPLLMAGHGGGGPDRLSAATPDMADGEVM